jgi:hypothetical protein
MNPGFSMNILFVRRDVLRAAIFVALDAQKIYSLS